MEISEMTNQEILKPLIDRVQFLLLDAHPGLFTWRAAIARAMEDLYDELNTYEWLRKSQ